MKATTAQNFVKVSFATVVLASILTGCGGTGTNTTGNTAVTKLAQLYKVDVIAAPASANNGSFNIELISPNGTMAGRYTSTSGGNVAFIVKNGKAIAQTPENKDCIAASVSDDGTLDGRSEDSNGDDVPFTTKGGNFHELPLPNGFLTGQASGRDNQGNLFVTYWDANSNEYSFKQGANVSKAITMANSTSIGLSAVSPAGMMAGYCKVSGQWGAAVYDSVTLDGTSTLVGADSPAIYAINDVGTHVGQLKEGGAYKSCVVKDGQVSILQPLDANTDYARLQAVNAGNVAVGIEQGPNSQIPVAWSQTDGYINLTSRIQPMAGVVIDQAHGISKSGVIVGIGRKNGIRVGIILTPITP